MGEGQRGAIASVRRLDTGLEGRDCSGLGSFISLSGGERGLYRLRHTPLGQELCRRGCSFIWQKKEQRASRGLEAEDERSSDRDGGADLAEWGGGAATN